MKMVLAAIDKHIDRQLLKYSELFHVMTRTHLRVYS